MLWMVLIRSVKAVASELPQANLMLVFANPQLSTLKCNSLSPPLLAKVVRREFTDYVEEEKPPFAITTFCCCQKVAATHLFGGHHDEQKKLKLKWDGWSPLKRKTNDPPKYKYVALLLQPKNTIASLLIYEQHHPVAATLTTTQWLKMHKKVSSHIFSMEIQKMRHFC